MSDQPIVCEHCGDTFRPAWTDEEAHAEYAAKFPDCPPDKVIVCDDCYKLLMSRYAAMRN